LTFAGQAITRFPHQVTEQDVGLQMFFKRLTLKKCIAKSVAKSTDCIGEDMVKHAYLE
jgi:hypothetical protein